MEPLVSVVMPVYNAEKYIQTSIDSLLNQTYSNIEIIVIDDASTDKTAQQISSINDNRIRYYKNDLNLGVGKSLNKAIQLSKGLLIARMDADDISHRQRLEKQVAYLQEHKDVELVFTRVEYINEQGDKIDFSWSNDDNIIHSDTIRWTLPRVNCITHVSVLFRRHLILDYLYEENIFAEDYELWLRMAAQGIKIAKIKDRLMSVRKHKESITASKIKRSDSNINQMIEVKKIFLKKKFLSGNINSFVVLTSFWFIKDIILYKTRHYIRLFWPRFDR